MFRRKLRKFTIVYLPYYFFYPIYIKFTLFCSTFLVFQLTYLKSRLDFSFKSPEFGGAVVYWIKTVALDQRVAGFDSCQCPALLSFSKTHYPQLSTLSQSHPIWFSSHEEIRIFFFIRHVISPFHPNFYRKETHTTQ